MATRRKGAPLSAGFVRGVKEAGRYGDGYGGGGLILQCKVSKYGRVSKHWVQRIRVGGRYTHMGLGAYPEVSLREARLAAHKNLEELRAGRDPRLRRVGPITFEAATEAKIALDRPSWKPGSRTEQNWRNGFSEHLYPSLGSKPVADLTTADFLVVLGPIWHTKPSQAQVLKRRASAVMKWAIAQGLRTDDPAGAALAAALPKNGGVKHHKALHHSAVGEALDKVGASASPAIGLGLRYLALTATRTGDVRGARWDEIDTEEGIWTIPGKRMKAGREHRVPLSSQALDVLDEAAERWGREGLVFVGRGGGMLGNSSFRNQFRKLEIAGTPHGMRTAFGSWCAETGVAREVAERALAHTVRSQTEAAYNRTDLLQARRRVMADWAAYIS